MSDAQNRAMDHVLTLVAPPDRFNASLATRAETALREAGAQVGAARTLRAGASIDVPFAGLAAADAEARVRARLEESEEHRTVDLYAQATAGRAKRLFVADLESTIIANEMLDEMATIAGCGDQVADITARAMAGEMGFEASLTARVAVFRDQSASLIDRAAETIRIHPGAERLLAGLRARSIVSALVTGGFHIFADALGARLGFDHVFANRLEIVDGHLTGKAVPPVLDRTAKRMTLLRLCEQLGIGSEKAIAIGDGANDLAMIAEAGLGVAYRAKPAVAEAADARIDHTDLETVLDFIGP